jgi:hypothetical protein
MAVRPRNLLNLETPVNCTVEEGAVVKAAGGGATVGEGGVKEGAVAAAGGGGLPLIGSSLDTSQLLELLDAGSRVRLVGLKTLKDMNGQSGVVVSYNEGKGRYDVDVTGEGIYVYSSMCLC